MIRAEVTDDNISVVIDGTYSIETFFDDVCFIIQGIYRNLSESNPVMATACELMMRTGFADEGFMNDIISIDNSSLEEIEDKPTVSNIRPLKGATDDKS